MRLSPSISAGLGRPRSLSIVGARSATVSYTHLALNPDLWGKLLDLLEEHQVTFHWVKGHAGHPENERCDQLAVAQSQKYAK